MSGITVYKDECGKCPPFVKSLKNKRGNSIAIKLKKSATYIQYKRHYEGNDDDHGDDADENHYDNDGDDDGDDDDDNNDDDDGDGDNGDADPDDDDDEDDDDDFDNNRELKQR